MYELFFYAFIVTKNIETKEVFVHPNGYNLKIDKIPSISACQMASSVLKEQWEKIYNENPIIDSSGKTKSLPFYKTSCQKYEDI